MSSVRLINETSATSVTSLRLTDVFSSEFDVYQIHIPEGTNNSGGGSANIIFQLVDVNGGIINTANYDYTHIVTFSYSATADTRNTNQTSIPSVSFNYAATAYGAATDIYLFNPYKSKYTYILYESIGWNSANVGTVGLKGVAVLKTTDVCKGFAITRQSNSFDNVAVQVYGLKEN